MAIIQNHPRFKKDYEYYLTKIQEIPEGEFKQEVTQLLNKLVAEVRKLDNMHMEMIYSRQLPTIGGEMKQSITATRKKLETRIKDWSLAQKN
jgi:hypothetical protein